ncbi:hypothetical protein QZH41_006773 [Actinostola sp. cb2023]|nr:hypothetical protein QZH41_006773 [Actinostola sp. cb2023]
MAGNYEASSSSSCPVIKINASQVASAIDCHPFQKKDETLNKIWRKSDSRTYFIGNALEHEEEIVEIVAEHWKNANGKVKEDFSQILFEDWDKQDYTLVQLLKEVFPESVSSMRESFRPLRREITDFVLSQTDSDFRDYRTLARAEVNTELQQEVKKLKEDVKRPVSTSVKEICEKKDIKNEETQKVIKGFLNKKRGIVLEPKAISEFEKKKHLKVQIVPERYETKMEYEGVCWILQGKIDGKLAINKKDRVIEVKTRIGGYKRPEYDIIQLQSYMFLCQHQEGILLEYLKDRQRETVVPFKEVDWNDRVVPALKEAVCKVKTQIETYQMLLDSCPDFHFISQQEEVESREDEESVNMQVDVDC